MELIKKFIDENEKDIPAPYRPKILKAAEKAVESGTISITHIPEHLREPYRRVLIEQSYRVRVKGQRFTAPKGAILI